jgi:hypothetical protein
MIFTKNLENEILKRHIKNSASDLIILGGFIGPSPVEKISKEEINTKIIYGCKAAPDKEEFHKKYLDISNNSDAEIFYKKTYNHSKIYCWHNNGVIKEIIAGSANFSTSGLNNDDQEILFLVNPSDFNEIYKYLEVALKDSVSCLKFSFTKKSLKRPKSVKDNYDKILSTKPPSARISFRDNKGQLSQINTGAYKASGSHVPIDDCVISLKSALVDEIPQLFPNNGINVMIGKGQGKEGKKKQPNAEFLWDDGEVMEMSFEQKGPKRTGGYIYKGLRSFKPNAQLGKYLRKRIGISSGEHFTDINLKHYGRDHFDLTLLEEGIYYADFSVENSTQNNDKK